MGRVKDIAATQYESHPCAAITEENKVYIWGRCNGQIVLKPTLTSFLTFDDVFAVATPPMTYQRFPLQNTKDEIKRKGPIMKRFPEVFDKPETADFAFIVGGKKIHAHKIILVLGSDVFKNLFLGDWKDSCQKEQIIEDHSYGAFYVFLKYFYTDEVNFTSELALEVYALARFYLVTDLMNECEKILKSGLTMQNAAAVYEKATLLGAKDLCEFCIKFCKKRWVDVVDNLESDDCKTEVVMEVFRWLAAGKKN
ncbi:RCC1 and BTB domain-containing protein 1-like [Cloeon dipterum]|uniref:RCC1 and BTB domain-containing protein 1-like n=1 Tax=Cloeon dipterum TaxID=197152 RepID=UPI00321FEC26